MTPGLVIAAPRSGTGKTTLTLGLLRAFARRGLAVSGTKCGPDYIDPAFHAAATGRPSLNLDSWAMSEALIGELASHAATAADLVVCEGLMGLFDGVPEAPGRSGSTADVAAALGWPVVLVHDVGGQSQTAAAQILGCATYDPRLQLAGVVLNRVGSERHRRLVTEALDRIGLPVLGALPRSPAVMLPERHLGLVQAQETSGLDALLDGLADLVETHVDLDALRAIARVGRTSIEAAGSLPVPISPPGQRVAVAQDVAFSFFYPHVAAGWRAAGAELLFFSPLDDEAPPAECDCCWLPGGYPELHAGRLSAARRFLAGLGEVAADRPVHGECGGYMVLGETLTDAEGACHRMAGLLGVETSFRHRKLMLGYREALLTGSCSLGAAGTRLKGHEFHYATVTAPGDDEVFAAVRDAYGAPVAFGGSRRGGVTGSFFHTLAAVQ